MTFLKTVRSNIAPMGLALAIAFATGVMIADTVSVSANTNSAPDLPRVTIALDTMPATPASVDDTTTLATARDALSSSAAPTIAVTNGVQITQDDTETRVVRTIIADGSEERSRRAHLERLAIGL